MADSERITMAELSRATANLDQSEAWLLAAADRAVEHVTAVHDGVGHMGGHLCPGDDTLEDLEQMDPGRMFVTLMAAVSTIAKLRRREKAQ